jgi:hypothetical protein
MRSVASCTGHARIRAVVSRLHFVTRSREEKQAMEQTMIVTRTSHTPRAEAIVVSTLLDAIVRLEARQRIGTVVLAGAYAADAELATCLGELYPSVHIEREV